MSNIERLTIALPKELADTVRTAVASGDYASSSEVFRDALRDWKVKRRVQLEEVESVRVALEKGLEDLRAGRVKPAEEVLSRLEAKYRNMT